MKKLSAIKKLLLFNMSFLFVILFSSSIFAQPFPINIEALGQDVIIESMTVSDNISDPAIYVTGRIGTYSSVSFSPSCYEDLTIPMNVCDPEMSYKIFIAKLVPDASSSSVEWMVIGFTDSAFIPNSFSGKDIEVDSGGNVYITSTIIGQVKFIQNYPEGCSFSISTCEDGITNLRHAVVKISPTGHPLWVAEARTSAASIESFGEGLTLDEPNNRLFTTGYISTYYSAGTTIFNDADCANRCGFSFAPIAPESPLIGFIAEYTLSGTNKRVQAVGERVMDITMDGDPNYQWITGSIKNLDGDVLLARTNISPLPPSGFCVNFDVEIVPTGGMGDDIGLDIDFTMSGKVILTGAYTDKCYLGTPLSAIGSTNSDLFVAVYQYGSGFLAQSGTSSITGVPISVQPIPYLNRSSCIDASPFNPNLFIIGYDRDGRDLISRELHTLLFPLGTGHVTGTSIASNARANEIQYSVNPTPGDRYLAGQYSGPYIFGPCSMTSTGFQNGYVARLNTAQNVYLADNGNQGGEIFQTHQVYPNPSQGKLSVKYTLETESLDVSLQIYDLSSRKIFQKSLSGFEGENSTELDLNLPNGTYLLQINAKGQSIYTERLVIIK